MAGAGIFRIMQLLPIKVATAAVLFLGEKPLR